MLQMLCIWGAFMPITTLYSNLVISKGKPNIYMWNTIALSLLQLTVMLVSYPYGIAVMIQCFVCLNILWVPVWQYFVWREIRLSLWMALKDILPFALIASATMAITWYVTSGISNLYLLLAAKIGVSAVLYCLLMWGSRVAIFKESLQFIGKKLPGKKI